MKRSSRRKDSKKIESFKVIRIILEERKSFKYYRRRFKKEDRVVRRRIRNSI